VVKVKKIPQNAKLGESYIIQIDDDDQRLCSKYEFIEEYVKPSTLWFTTDFKYVHGTPRMIENLISLCEDLFGDDLEKHK